jgi:hypothetical protein
MKLRKRKKKKLIDEKRYGERERENGTYVDYKRTKKSSYYSYTN